VKIREGQERNGEYLNIGKREEDLAYDLMDEVKQVVYRLGKELLVNRKKMKEEREEERGRNRNRREEHREERVAHKKETDTAI
jgi:CRISPR/Cas system-associated endonuclease Cas1